MRILLVDDQRSARRALASILADVNPEGLEVFEASSLTEATSILESQPIDCALVDIRLSSDPRNRDGLQLIRQIRETSDAIPVVVTVYNEMDEIRAAMRNGAFDYILKDELCAELVAPILTAIGDRRRLESEVLELRARSSGEPPLPDMVGASSVIQRLRANVRRVAVSDRPVLVVGPTGCGKELVVRAIHALGSYPHQPLLDINCGAIPDALMESQLFGHERGAFTSADRRQEGYLTSVGRGTLFLDEIAELSLPLQAKLLRVLETKQFRPIGSVDSRSFEGRIVAATHAHLESRVSEGRFREDLLFRLNVLVVRVPSLDERKEDIPLLVAHFLRGQNRRIQFSEDALNALIASSWPGNVRQLRNLIDRVVVFSDSEIVTAQTLADIDALASPAAADSLDALVRAIVSLPIPNKMEATERSLIGIAMALTDGNKSAAARLLGMHRKAIERRIEAIASSTSPEDDDRDS